MGRNFLSAFSAVLAFCVLLCSLPASGAENLTAENRRALEETLMRLRNTELLRVTRGRLKSNPILLTHHTVYVQMLMNTDGLLATHTLTFRNTLARLSDISSPAVHPADESLIHSTAHFEKRLVEFYDLRPELESRDTILGAWRALNSSRFSMLALPQRARLDANSRRWVASFYRKDPVPDWVSRELDRLMKDSGEYHTLFDMDECLASLSAEYSHLFHRIVSGNALPPPGAHPSEEQNETGEEETD